MAINLWEAEGRLTSYNPLPDMYISIPIRLGDYRISLKAKSVSGGRLQLATDGGIEFSEFVPVNGELQTFVYEFTNKSKPNLLIGNLDSKSDMVVQDIEVVEKPLGVATINGLDGFLSGKWDVHANAKVIDDETLEHIPTAINELSTFFLNVEPNKTYYFNLSKTAPFDITFFDTPDRNLANGYYNGLNTFTTKSTTKEVRIRLIANNVGTKYTFKRPTLNLGSTPAPYEKKRGERMVLPVPKKNLMRKWNTVKAELVGFHYVDIDDTDVKLEVGKTYTLSWKYNIISADVGVTDTNVQIHLGGGQVAHEVLLKSVLLKEQKMTFTWAQAWSDGYSNAFRFRLSDYVGLAYNSVIDYWDIQLEEGTQATPYEPYAVQVNENVKTLVPKKNLFDKKMFSVISSKSNVTVTETMTGVKLLSDGTSTTFKRATMKINVKPHTNYVMSCKMNLISGPNYHLMRVLGVGLDRSIGSTASTTFNSGANVQIDFYLYLTFATGDNGEVEFNDIQLEEGTFATPFEPYVEVNPNAIVLNEWEYVVSNSSLTSLDNHIGSGWNLRNLFSTLKAPTDSVLIDGAGNVIERVLSFGHLTKFNQYYLTPESVWLNVQSDADLKFPYQLAHKPTKPTYAKRSQYPNVFKMYQPKNKPSTGLLMDGVTNYLRLPSMTMDSVEIDCLIDPIQSVPTRYLIDARIGLTDGYAYELNNGSLSPGVGISSITGYVKEQRTKVKITPTIPFTDDVTIFANYLYNERMKGTLYGVKCYLNGKVVAEYDFTKENAKANAVLIGTKTWQQKQAKR